MKAKLNKPQVLLFVLAPVCGELITGSSPPLEFFNPLAFLILATLYGTGALLVRELSYRWDKGWLAILVLGAAYGIVEEGLAVKSFFDPGWGDLGPLASYGRMGGVNWVWASQLTVYHAAISIGIPILLVNLLYPGRVGEPWLSNRALRGVAVVFAANVAFDYLVLNPYSPPPVAYAGFAFLAALLVLVARRLPARIGIAGARRRASTRRIALVGFAATVSVFMIVGDGFPDWGIPASIAAIAPFVLALLAMLFAFRSGASAWSPRQRLAIAAGALGFWIILSPVQEFAAGAIGMTLVGAATAFLLWRLDGRLRLAEPGSASAT